MSALEEYERQRGLAPAHVSEWHTAAKKAREDPAALTDRDILIVGHFAGAKEELAALDAREAMLHPLPPPPPPAPPPPAPSNLGLIQALTNQVDAALSRHAADHVAALAALTTRLGQLEQQLMTRDAADVQRIEAAVRDALEDEL